MYSIILSRKTLEKFVFHRFFFTNNDEHFEDSKDVVHNFKKYFVSVWPKLAEKIPDPTTAGALNETLISRNPYSMFLTAVVEREIWDIVSKCKNKRSTDCDGIDMTRIKKVIE